MELFLATGTEAIHGQGYWNHAKEYKFQRKTYSTNSLALVKKVSSFNCWFYLASVKTERRMPPQRYPEPMNMLSTQTWSLNGEIHELSR